MHGRHPFTVVERYSATAQLLHWTTMLLVAAAYMASVGSSEMRIYSSANDFSRSLHELLGLSVFALTLARAGWRAIFPAQESRHAGLDGAGREALALDDLCAARHGAAHGHSRRMTRRPPADGAC